MKPLHFIARLRIASFPRLLGILLSTVVGSLDAATITVTNKTDNVTSPGVGSLRSAIVSAADGDTIEFDSSITGTITLAGAELVLDKNLTITGPGAATLAVSANQLSRVFNVAAGRTVAISGLTVRDGKTAPAGPPGDLIPAGNGGGILNAGTLSLTDCIITGNQTGGGGTYGGNGGGIANSGSLAMSGCEVSGNIAASGNFGGGNGGGINNSGTFSGHNLAFRSKNLAHPKTSHSTAFIYGAPCRIMSRRLAKSSID